MDGMFCEHLKAVSLDDTVTYSYRYNFAPKPTIAQVGLSTGSFDGGYTAIGFTDCAYVDAGGAYHTENFPDVGAQKAVRLFGRTGMTSVGFQIRVHENWGEGFVNFYFWPSVY